MCTISARDFRQNMSKSLDMVSRGEELIITRGNDYFMVSKVQMAPVITPELQAELDAARQRIAEGDCVVMKSQEDIDNWLNNL